MTHTGRPWRKLIAGLAGVLLAAPVLAACASEPAPPPVEPTLDPVPPISFGVLRAPTGALAVVTGDKGWFAEKGVEVKFESFAEGGGPAIIQAMAGGTPDIALLNTAAVVQALGQGTFDVQIVSIAADPAKALPLIAVSEITSVEDLRGKRVSTPKGGGQYYLLAAILAKHDMTFDDIDYKPLAVGEAQAAFLTGQLDAVISSVNGTALIKKNMPDVNVLFDGYDFDAVDDYSSPDVLIATREVVDNNPEGVARFVAAYHESGVGFLEDPATRDEAVKAIMDYMTSVGAGIDELESTRDAVDAISFPSLADAQARLASPEYLAALAKQAQFWIDSGVFEKMPDFASAINATLVK